MNQPALNRWAPLIARIGPAVNRLVFAGPAIVFPDRGGSTQVRTLATASRGLEAIATVSPDRLTAELNASGLTCARRTRDGDLWRSEADVIQISSASDDTPSASDEALAREYAVLLTNTESLADGVPVRVVSRAAQLALWVSRAARGLGAKMVNNVAAEDLVELALQDARLEADVGALPDELRGVVSRGLAQLLADEAFPWLLGRVLRDGRTTPRVEDVALGQLRQLLRLSGAGGTG